MSDINHRQLSLKLNDLEKSLRFGVLGMRL